MKSLKVPSNTAGLATTNPFDLLEYDHNEDSSQVLASHLWVKESAVSISPASDSSTMHSTKPLSPARRESGWRNNYIAWVRDGRGGFIHYRYLSSRIKNGRSGVISFGDGDGGNSLGIDLRSYDYLLEPFCGGRSGRFPNENEIFDYGLPQRRLSEHRNLVWREPGNGDADTNNIVAK